MFFKTVKKLSKSRRVTAAALVLSTMLTSGSAHAQSFPLFQLLPDKQTVRVPDGRYFRLISSAAPGVKPPTFSGEGSGNLDAFDPQGKKLGRCVLKHTDVSVKVTGYIASVNVTQKFHNPFKDKIEALYTFPLSSTGAVDEMEMHVGNRTISGTIRRKEEARQIYNNAKSQGYVAALLDQERPNIFSQSVANIEPGKDVDVVIHYVDVLPYEAGTYTFAFPTVVGPRFIPPSMMTSENGQVPGAVSSELVGSNLNPPYKTDSGHDISISMDIDAAVSVNKVYCPTHSVNLNPLSESKAHIDLANQHSIPNKDFVLSWKVAGDKVRGGYFTERLGKSGYVSMMLLPPARVTPATAAPKEMIFVVDTSGSQSGTPLLKAKETLSYIVKNMNPNDTFQVLSFSSDARTLFSQPEKANPKMIQKALKYIDSLEASGGTMMEPAVEAICKIPADEHRLRIVTFMTDGYVGNDMEVLSVIKRTRGNARWFSFGTGGSVNRFLIEEMAKVGGGESEVILLQSPGEVVAKKFYDRISSPVLTDVKISTEGIELVDVFPRQVSDVWAERPLYFQARYTKPGHGKVKLAGYAGGKPYSQVVDVTLPDHTQANNHIAQIWARSVVDDLMALDWVGVQNGTLNSSIRELVTRMGVNYHIMTQFTSFIAVDRDYKTAGGAPLTTTVAAEVPEGVSLDSVLSGATFSLSTDQPEKQINAVGSATSSSPQASAESESSYSSAPSPSTSYSGGGSGGSFGDAFSSQAVIGEQMGMNNTFYNTGTQTIPVRNGSSPILQGATNGSMGPRGFNATSVMGVNTAGTVSVHNLANNGDVFDNICRILPNVLNIVCSILGMGAIVGGIINIIRKKKHGTEYLAGGIAWLAALNLFWYALVPWSCWLLAGIVSKKLAKRFGFFRAKHNGGGAASVSISTGDSDDKSQAGSNVGSTVDEPETRPLAELSSSASTPDRKR